jgi:hypothetical protein
MARALFALFAVLVVLGLFVLDGAAAGVVLFVGIFVFIAACMIALRSDSRDVDRSSRAGITGWFGHWF